MKTLFVLSVFGSLVGFGVFFASVLMSTVLKEHLHWARQAFIEIHGASSTWRGGYLMLGIVMLICAIGLY